jgi:hypothetical protein
MMCPYRGLSSFASSAEIVLPVVILSIPSGTTDKSASARMPCGHSFVEITVKD